MLVVEVELLTGRYTATRFNDRDAVEWPPHPARLFSAMVAAWAGAEEPDSAEHSALEWLEALGPPHLNCSSHEERIVVTHFVPDNDVTALARDLSGSYLAIDRAAAEVEDADVHAAGPDDKRLVRARRDLDRARTKAAADAAKAGSPSGRETSAMVGASIGVLPDQRGRHARTYPTALPDEPVFRLSWPDANPSPAQAEALDHLLARVGRLGHSSTFVSCRLVADASPPTHIPLAAATGGSDEVVLRVPRAGLLERLETAFEAHRGEEPRTLPSGSAVYGRPGTPRPVVPRSVLGGEWVVLGLPPDTRLSLTRALDLTRAVRSALMKHAAQPPPEVLTGHAAGQPGATTSPSSRPHLALLPLANVGHPHATTAVLGIALALPQDLGDEDRDAVLHALSRWRDVNRCRVSLGGSAGRPVAFELVPEERLPARATLERTWWCGPARTWRTVTPVALDRFPGDLGHPRSDVRQKAEQEALEAVDRSCRHLGLPAPDSVVLSFAGLLKGVPGVRRSRSEASPQESGQGRPGIFPAYRTGSSNQPRVCVHAEVTFATPVEGPVVLGAGRYLGYGLFLPDQGRR